MKIKKISMFIFVLTSLLVASCGSRQKAGEPMADSGRTVRTENLLVSMKRIASDGQFMFGHHDDTAYGVGWVGDSARSDVQSVCGDYPAVVGFDLGGIELGRDGNLDGVAADRLRRNIIQHFDRGGMVTLSWHCNNPLSGRHAWMADSLSDVESHTVSQILAEGSTHEKFLAWLDRVADFLNSLKTPYGVRVPGSGGGRIIVQQMNSRRYGN